MSVIIDNNYFESDEELDIIYSMFAGYTVVRQMVSREQGIYSQCILFFLFANGYGYRSVIAKAFNLSYVTVGFASARLRDAGLIYYNKRKLLLTPLGRERILTLLSDARRAGIIRVVRERPIKKEPEKKPRKRKVKDQNL